MNIQILSNSTELTKPLTTFFKDKGAKIFQGSGVENFFNNCTEYPSNIYVIQADIYSELRVLDIIRDIRLFFGAYPLIFVISKEGGVKSISNFLGVGVDNIFYIPFDLALLEDHISQTLKRDVFLPIHYRNVPSGGSPAHIDRKISLNEISSEGVRFYSDDLLTSGLIFQLDLQDCLEIDIEAVSCRIITTDTSEQFLYSYKAEFFEVDAEDLKKIRHALKHT